MQAINDTELLELWELTASRSPLEKSLLPLAYACPEYDAGQLAALPIGARDARLLRLRELMFGHQLRNVAHCPACAQKVEWEMATDSLKMPYPEAADAPPGIEWASGTQTYHFRLPNSADLIAIAALPNASKPVALLQRCLLDDTPLPEELPDDALEQIAGQMALHDPQADIEIELNCPGCAHQWPVTFDIGQYLWQELQERAIYLLQEVCLLAARFGWSEKDILAMSRRRRNLYLNMLQA